MIFSSKFKNVLIFWSKNPKCLHVGQTESATIEVCLLDFSLKHRDSYRAGPARTEENLEGPSKNGPPQAKNFEILAKKMVMRGQNWAIFRYFIQNLEGLRRARRAQIAGPATRCLKSPQKGP